MTTKEVAELLNISEDWVHRNTKLIKETKKGVRTEYTAQDVEAFKKIIDERKQRKSEMVSKRFTGFHRVQTEETKRKISEKLKGQKQSEETKNKKSLAFKTLWKDDEYREKVIQSRLNIAEAHGASLRFESEVGRGTKIFFDFTT